MKIFSLLFFLVLSFSALGAARFSCTEVWNGPNNDLEVLIKEGDDWMRAIVQTNSNDDVPMGWSQSVEIEDECGLEPKIVGRRFEISFDGPLGARVIEADFSARRIISRFNTRLRCVDHTESYDHCL